MYMFTKRSVSEKVFDLINYVFLGIVVILTLYPLVFCLFASVSDPYRMMAHSGILAFPLGITFDSYKLVFKNPMILIGYGNTLIYLISGTLLNVVLTVIGAYFLSRKNVMFQRPIALFIIFTMFFSGGLIPLFLIVQGIGLYNSRLAMILPTAISVYNLIVMRSSFDAIPSAMEESAQIDGASHATILLRVILPLSKAVTAVIILFYAAYHWNAWFHALIFLRNRNLYPLQVILREILISNDTTASVSGSSGLDIAPVAVTVKYATVIVATLPILTIYPFVQKHFVKGVMLGAVKG